jgi:hypothetical protein
MLAATDVPSSLFRSEATLTAFLDSGICDDPPLSIDSLSDDQFVALESVINAWVADGWRQRAMAALSKHRLVRFGRYA